MKTRANVFGQGIETVGVQVTDGIVRVWDSVAGHYTMCHQLSDSQCARLAARARKELRQRSDRVGITEGRYN